MALTRCKNGHFYDGHKYMGCPFCGVDLTGAAFKGVPLNASGHNLGDEVATVAAHDLDDNSVTVAKQDADADSKTIGIYDYDDNGVRGTMLAGWLVCVKGPERGRDYRVRVGSNQVGRSIGMDICLTDPYVSLKDHVRIIYDPASNAYFLAPAESTEVECNGKSVFSAVSLHDGDKIRLGGSRYIFVAFCKEGRRWENES